VQPLEAGDVRESCIFNTASEEPGDAAREQTERDRPPEVPEGEIAYSDSEAVDAFAYSFSLEGETASFFFLGSAARAAPSFTGAVDTVASPATVLAPTASPTPAAAIAAPTAASSLALPTSLKAKHLSPSSLGQEEPRRFEQLRPFLLPELASPSLISEAASRYDP